jgi:probable HAF family extracellular repeat protein
MRRVSNLRIAVLLACLIAVPLSSGRRLPPWRYTVVDLGTLQGNSYSEGLGINILGHVVGCSGEPGYVCDDSSFQFTNGFMWTKERGIKAMKPLPGGTNAYADAINDSDWVAGSSSGTAFHAQLHAVVWEDEGRVLDLGTLDKTCYDSCNSYAHAISDNGLVVGGSDLPPRDSFHAFLWNEESGMTDLGTVKYDTSNALAVNLRAGVAGWVSTLATGTNAFFWTPREGMRDLGTLKCATSQWSIAFGINNFNQVVGLSACTGGDHAFLWTKAKGMRDLGVLGQDTDSGALAIDDNGQIVGWSGSNTYLRAFIWSHHEGMRDLNDFIAPNSGWVLNSANGINILGQITGRGTINGQSHAFLLTLRHQNH